MCKNKLDILGLESRNCHTFEFLLQYFKINLHRFTKIVFPSDLMICMSDNISTISSKSMRFLSVDNIDRLGTVRRKGRGIIL